MQMFGGGDILTFIRHVMTRVWMSKSCQFRILKRFAVCIILELKMNLFHLFNFFQGLNIPLVTLLLEGGKDAIRIVRDHLRKGIACVAIDGSGRAADIVSYAYKNAFKDPVRYYKMIHTFSVYYVLTIWFVPTQWEIQVVWGPLGETSRHGRNLLRV